MSATRSAALFDRVKARVPAGVHSNSRARSPHPIFFERAQGAHVWDVDGNRLLDCTMGNAAVVLGHGDPRVGAAVGAAVASGITTGHETPRAVAVVELLGEIVPGLGMVRFANTGTEALMHALRIARAATGRQRVAKVESSYHGWSDPLWVSCWAPPAAIGDPAAPAPHPGSPGLSRDAADTIVLPFNDADAAERILRTHADELAAVVTEPILIDIGYVPAEPAYLERLRTVAAELGIVLVLDELLTGFRVAPGGARERYDVRADLTILGKALANGYPLAAVTGDPELLGLTDPLAGGEVGYVGTYNGHHIALAAAEATLLALRDGGVHEHLETLTARLRDGFAELSARHGVPCVLAGGGGHFQPYFMPRAPRSYRDALTADPARYAALQTTLLAEGILIAEKPLLHCALSAAHDAADVDRILAAAEAAFHRMGKEAA